MDAMKVDELIMSLEKIALEDISKSRVVDLAVQCIKNCDEIFSIVNSERLNNEDKVEVIRDILGASGSEQRR